MKELNAVDAGPSKGIDWRILSSVGFYLGFCLLASAMSSPKQKDGLRLSLALAVVFGIFEVELLLRGISTKNMETLKLFKFFFS